MWWEYADICVFQHNTRPIAGVSTADGNGNLIRKFGKSAAAKPKCVTTDASRKLASILNTILEGLAEKDEEFAAKNDGIRRFWVKLNMNDFNNMIKKRLDACQGKQIRTYDFKKMYTNLTHKEIRRNVRAVVVEYKEWKTEEESGVPSVEYIMEHLDFILDNIYVENGNRQYKQEIGIPMGTNAAPPIANLTLYTTEAEYIDKLLEKGDHTTAKQLCLTGRFIDDLITVGLQGEFASDIYKDLELAETTEVKDKRVIYLGTQIDYDRMKNTIKLSVYDKSANWQFPVIKFPTGQGIHHQLSHQG